MGVVGNTGLMGGVGGGVMAGTMGRTMGRSTSATGPNVAGALARAVEEEERRMGGLFGCGEVENEKWVCILGEILRFDFFFFFFYFYFILFYF